MFNILHVLRCRDEFHSSGYKCLWGPFEMVVEYARNLSYMPQCKMAHSQNLSWWSQGSVANIFTSTLNVEWI